MQTFDHLIIGGGIAGVTAAETVRQRAPEDSVAILGAEPHRLYSRVMLPHVLRGRVAEAQAFLRTEDWYAEKRISYFAGARVAAVDTGARQLTLADGSKIGYGKSLLIATGGDVRKLDCPGADEAEPLYFQTLDDTRRIASTAARTAAVYGGGFISLELHMSLAHMGVRTTAVMRGDGFFSRTLDPRSRARVADEFAKRGIQVRIGVEISAIENAQGGAKRLHLTDGATLDCDAIAVGIGLRPNVGFLAGSGLAIDTGVIVDERLRASAPGVFAAGDVAEYPDQRTGERRMTGNWQNAMFQGRLAGANMTGGDDPFTALTSYAISCFGLPIAVVGAAEAAGPGIERVVRDGMDATLQFVIKGDRVIGASCVGAYSERAAVTKLITGGVALTASARAALADPRVPLSSLVV